MIVAQRPEGLEGDFMSGLDAGQPRIKIDPFGDAGPPRASTMAAGPRLTVSDAAPPIMFRFDLDNAALAGASMSTVNEDLGHAFGVASGVLVLSAAPGSVAVQSGLRGGDVIVKAGGKTVASVRDLRQLLATAPDGRSLELQIMRDRKARTIVLKW